MSFEVISIPTAWSQLITIYLNSTKFLGIFETGYSSRSGLIRNLISTIEFALCGKILSEKSLYEIGKFIKPNFSLGHGMFNKCKKYAGSTVTNLTF